MKNDIETNDDLLKAINVHLELLKKRNPSFIGHTDEYREIIDQLKEHILPERYPSVDSGLLGGVELGMESILFREVIISLSGFTALAYDWIRPLAEWIGKQPCLEIMSGSGALAYGLHHCGVDIIATDNGDWLKSSPEWFTNPWFEVERLDCLQAIEKHVLKRPIVICSWPEMNDMAYQALLKMRAVNPDAMMIFIGEGGGFFGCGATADEQFLKEVEIVEDTAFKNAASSYKPFSAVHDHPHLVK